MKRHYIYIDIGGYTPVNARNTAIFVESRIWIPPLSPLVGTTTAVNVPALSWAAGCRGRSASDYTYSSHNPSWRDWSTSVCAGDTCRATSMSGVYKGGGENHNQFSEINNRLIELAKAFSSAHWSTVPKHLHYKITVEWTISANQQWHQFSCLPYLPYPTVPAHPCELRQPSP